MSQKKKGEKCSSQNLQTTGPTDKSVCQYYLSVSSHCRYIGYQSMCSLIGANIKTVFLRPKNAWTSDLKWSNYVVCPAEGGQLFNN